MTKELFIATINSIQKQIEIDRKNSSMLQEMFPDDSIYCGYNNSELFNALNKILKESMKDEYDWIDYFMYELDFGEKYYDGCVLDKDKSIINLSTAENLYEFLKRFSKKSNSSLA